MDIDMNTDITEPVPDGKIPLGICRQAVMKLDSFMADIGEILEDPDVDQEDRPKFETMIEIAGRMMATIICIVDKERSEEEFMGIEVAMDEIAEYPSTDIMDIPINS